MPINTQSLYMVSTKYYASPDCTYEDKDSLKSFLYSNINGEALPNKWEHVSIDFETDSKCKIVQER